MIDFDLGTVMTSNTGGVADVGAKSGLGAVTTIPTAGYVTTLSAIVGHGYVVEARAAFA